MSNNQALLADFWFSPAPLAPRMSPMEKHGPNRGFGVFPMRGEILGIPEESELKNASLSLRFI